jgi:hypothetical protein
MKLDKPAACRLTLEYKRRLVRTPLQPVRTLLRRHVYAARIS